MAQQRPSEALRQQLERAVAEVMVAAEDFLRRVAPDNVVYDTPPRQRPKWRVSRKVQVAPVLCFEVSADITELTCRPPSYLLSIAAYITSEVGDVDVELTRVTDEYTVNTPYSPDIVRAALDAAAMRAVTMLQQTGAPLAPRLVRPWPSRISHCVDGLIEDGQATLHVGDVASIRFERHRDPALSLLFHVGAVMHGHNDVVIAQYDTQHDMDMAGLIREMDAKLVADDRLDEQGRQQQMRDLYHTICRQVLAALAAQMRQQMATLIEISALL